MRRIGGRSILFTITFGLASALAIGVIAFALLPETQLRTVFIGPGVAVMGFFAHLIPESAIESLITQRWVPSFFGVAFTLSVAVWTCVFAGCLLATRRLQGTRKA